MPGVIVPTIDGTRPRAVPVRERDRPRVADVFATAQAQMGRKILVDIWLSYQNLPVGFCHEVDLTGRRK